MCIPERHVFSRITSAGVPLISFESKKTLKKLVNFGACCRCRYWYYKIWPVSPSAFITKRPNPPLSPDRSLARSLDRPKRSIAGSLDHSIARPVARSPDRSRARSLDRSKRSIAGSLDHSIARPVARSPDSSPAWSLLRSLGRSLGRSIRRAFAWWRAGNGCCWRLRCSASTLACDWPLWKQLILRAGNKL